MVDAAVIWLKSFLCYLGILTMIMVRTLRRDIAQYNKDDDLVSLASKLLSLCFKKKIHVYCLL